jgi:hypothetical protein
MPGVFPINAVGRALHKRRRDRELAAAGTWPLIEAHLLKPAIVEKDELAEGTTVQDSQVEIPFYFTIEGEGAGSGYFGGHLRTVALSHSEASRLLPRILEGTMIRVRYDPRDPDQNHALASDNEGLLPVGVWSN